MAAQREAGSAANHRNSLKSGGKPAVLTLKQTADSEQQTATLPTVAVCRVLSAVCLEEKP
jgi:hypothetical protein